MYSGSPAQEQLSLPGPVWVLLSTVVNSLIPEVDPSLSSLLCPIKIMGKLTVFSLAAFLHGSVPGEGGG